MSTPIDSSITSRQASLQIKNPDNAQTSSEIQLQFAGPLCAHSIAILWKNLNRLLAQIPGQTSYQLDLTQVSYMDTAGAALVREVIRRQGLDNLTLLSADARHKQLLNLFADFAPPVRRPYKPRTGFFSGLGSTVRSFVQDFVELIEFVGQFVRGLSQALLQPGRVRWREVLTVATDVGVKALLIIFLIGFLLGLIISFQSAIPLRMFGAEIFVAQLLGLSIFRELGPLVTAIILAGRSGSSFAAELGTMKINEELSALQTMGLDPLRFLIVPRMLAAMIMTPLLTIFFNLFSLLGGAVVMLSMGYPLVTYINQMGMALQSTDILGGLFKAFVFSILVAWIGCVRGLQTGSGASAVGRSTTSAVVSGIILIAVMDGIFALVFYALGI